MNVLHDIVSQFNIQRAIYFSSINKLIPAVSTALFQRHIQRYFSSINEILSAVLDPYFRIIYNTIFGSIYIVSVVYATQCQYNIILAVYTTLFQQYIHYFSSI